MTWLDSGGQSSRSQQAVEVTVPRCHHSKWTTAWAISLVEICPSRWGYSLYRFVTDKLKLWTVRILGTRVSELENKLKTLELTGLWNVTGNRNKCHVLSTVMLNAVHKPRCIGANFASTSSDHIILSPCMGLGQSSFPLSLQIFC